MASMGDIEVTIRADDRVSPVLRRMRRQVWWWEYGYPLLVGVPIVTFVLGFIAGGVLTP